MMNKRKPWDALKVGSIILTIWCSINALVGLGCLVYIIIFNQNAPGFQMLFSPSEIQALPPKVLATTNSIAIVANACITIYAVSIIGIIWNALIYRQKWAFWFIATTAIFALKAGYLSDSFIGNMNIASNIASTILVTVGLGLSAYGVFGKKKLEI
jgi:hypothetical protein